MTMGYRKTQIDEKEIALGEAKRYIESLGMSVNESYGDVKYKYGITFECKNKSGRLTFIRVQRSSFFGINDGKVSNDELMYDRRRAYRAQREFVNWMSEGRNSTEGLDLNIYYMVYKMYDGKPYFLMSPGKKCLIRMENLLDESGNSKITSVMESYSYAGLFSEQLGLPF